MARYEASAAAPGVDFHLPDEILAVIPTDPYEQLDVARKITSMAITSRVSRLEADAARLRRDLVDRDHAEAELRARLADSDARLAAALDENVSSRPFPLPHRIMICDWLPSLTMILCRAGEASEGKGLARRDDQKADQEFGKGVAFTSFLGPSQFWLQVLASALIVM
jgi:hypothetical protein